MKLVLSGGLTQIWRQLVEAPAAITDSERRQQIRFLSGLLVVLIPLVYLALGIRLLLIPGFWPTFAPVAAVLAMLFVAYGLARAGRYTAGALITVGIGVIAVFMIVLLNPADAFHYAFLIISVLLAALLFDEIGVWVTAMANLIGASVVLPALGVPPPLNDPTLVPIFLAIISALLLIGIRHRNAIERDRQASLVASEEFAAGLIDNAPVIVLLLDNDARIMRVNRYFEQLSGYRADDVLGRNWFDTLLPERDRDRIRTVFTRARTGTSTRGNVNPIVTRTGEEREIEWSDSVLHDVAGNITGVLAIGQDVTERRRAELALRESEAHLRAVIGNVPVVLYTLDRKGVIQLSEGKGLATLNLKPGETVGRSVFEMYADYPEIISIIHRALAGEAVVQIVSLGSLTFEVHYSPTFDAEGRVETVIGLAIDISERQRAEEMQTQLVERLDLATRSARIGIWDWDVGNNELIWDDRMFELYGVRREKFSGAYDAWIAGLHPDDRERTEEAVARALRNEAPYDIEFHVRWPDGTVRSIKAGGLVVRDDAGKALRMIGTNYDITEQRRAERALRDSEQLLQLSQSVAHIGSWQWNTVTGEVSWSQEMYPIYGLPQTNDPITFDRAMAAIHPDDHDSIVSEIQAMLVDQDANSFEYRVVRPDGRVRHVWAHSEVQRAADGSPLRVIGTVQDITERKQAEESLLEIARGVSATTGETFFHSLVAHLARALQADYSFVGEIILDRADHIRTIAVQANGEPVDNFEYALAGTPCQDVVGNETCSHLRDVQIQFPDDHMLKEMGVHAYVGTPLFGAGGRALGLITVLYRDPIGQDATIRSTLEIFAARAAGELERLHAETQMRKLSSALEQTVDVVMITDRSGIIEYVNSGFEKTTGYGRDEAVGRKPSLLKSGKQGAAFYKKLWGTILAGEVFSEVFVNRRKDGSLYYDEKTITPLKDDAGAITHFVATGKDVTERVQAQERLQYMAQHDALTELPNRLLFVDRLKQALARARWHQRLVGVLFVDMDRFKNINDTLGHETGDQLLQALAGRFANSVREGDTVARFGGDEFVILLDDVASEKDISAVAKKVLEALAPPFVIDQQSLYVTASIGVSLYPNDGEDSGTLLRNADIAMYRAKELGKNTYQFYSADMSARVFERMTLESSLRRAIEKKEFRLYYQPQIDTVSGAIVGVEALLRWQHPDFGLVAPTEFTPLLEETGLIVPVGEWVFHAACKQLVAWHAAGWPTLRMAVNLSPRQFQAAGLETMVESGLAAVDCDPKFIELEITENVLLRHATTTLDTLDALREIGVRLAIDDFGTGYSSLGYLRRYSIDTLKVDRSFVHDVPGDADDCALATAIIVLAQSLKLEVIAEGVENEAQRDFLRERGCHHMQGYLFSRPLPAEDIPALLEIHNPKS